VVVETGCKIVKQIRIKVPGKVYFCTYYIVMHALGKKQADTVNVESTSVLPWKAVPSTFLMVAAHFICARQYGSIYKNSGCNTMPMKTSRKVLYTVMFMSEIYHMNHSRSV